MVKSCQKAGRDLNVCADESPSVGFASIIIPVKDEANSIAGLISEIKENLDGNHHEIIVIDDGSEDKTAEIARAGGAVVVSHGRNLGKGAAMKTGVNAAQGDTIVFIDGDGAHYPHDILRIIAPISAGEADLVIGSRALPESEVFVSPFARKLSNGLASSLMSVIVSLLLPLVMLKSPKRIRITDCTSGFRAINRETWQKLALTSQEFQIEAEMIYEAAKHDLVITEVPIGCKWDSHLSHLSVVRDGSKTLLLLARKLLGDMGRRH
ncbi:MAG TPA: glycosyltransferase family 2 protein [Dehalococcoidia bacterium]|nr:glycosyltransferase family 2 protein [Dehalococcoidia bacterium]